MVALVAVDRTDCLVKNRRGIDLVELNKFVGCEDGLNRWRHSARKEPDIV